MGSRPGTPVRMILAAPVGAKQKEAGSLWLFQRSVSLCAGSRGRARVAGSAEPGRDQCGAGMLSPGPRGDRRTEGANGDMRTASRLWLSGSLQKIRKNFTHCNCTVIWKNSINDADASWRACVRACVCHREAGESRKETHTLAWVTKHMPTCWHLSRVQVFPVIPVDTPGRPTIGSLTSGCDAGSGFSATECVMGTLAACQENNGSVFLGA